MMQASTSITQLRAVILRMSMPSHPIADVKLILSFLSRTCWASAVASRSPRVRTECSLHSRILQQDRGKVKQTRRNVHAEHWWSRRGLQMCGHRVRIHGVGSIQHAVGGTICSRLRHTTGMQGGPHRGTPLGRNTQREQRHDLDDTG
jgi:hypothetical protein